LKGKDRFSYGEFLGQGEEALQGEIETNAKKTEDS